MAKKKTDVTVYCLRYPDGSLEAETARAHKEECWIEGFWVVCGLVKGFEQKYWKKWNPSIMAAKKLGYEIVECNLVKV